MALLAPAIPSDSVCEDDGEYAAAIQASAGSVHNYRSSNDDVVCDLYSSRLLGAGTDGLGCRSPDCGSGWGWYRDEGSTPSNFHDHDVSRTVTKHCNYPRPGEGCVSDVVADFGKGDGSGDDESDDNSDDDGWGWGW